MWLNGCKTCPYTYRFAEFFLALFHAAEQKICKKYSSICWDILESEGSKSTRIINQIEHFKE